MKITTKWMKHPRESAAECFLPFPIIVGGLTALVALFPLLGGDNPVFGEE